MALREVPAYPADLAELLGVSRQIVSNHLASLRGCGLVVVVPEGRRVRYELADGRLSHALGDLPGVVLAIDASACRAATVEEYQHGSTADTDRRNLLIARGLLVAFMGVEVVVALTRGPWCCFPTPATCCPTWGAGGVIVGTSAGRPTGCRRMDLRLETSRDPVRLRERHHPAHADARGLSVEDVGARPDSVRTDAT